MIANEAGDSAPRGRPTYEVVRLAKLAAVPKILHFPRVTLYTLSRSFPTELSTTNNDSCEKSSGKNRFYLKRDW